MAIRGVTKKAPTKKKGAPAPPAKEKGPRLGGHGYDVAGLVLVLLALVAALSVYADLAGPAGRALGDGAGVVLGYGRWALPFLLAAAGGMLLWREVPGDPGRLAVGLSLTAVAGCGLLHLATGGPGWGASADELRSSGGIVGTGAAVPLRAVLAGPGAAAVLLTLLGVALLVLTRTTVRTAAYQAAVGLRKGWDALVELRPPPLPAVPEPEAPLPDLHAPEPEPEPAAVEVRLPPTPVEEPADQPEQLAIDLGPSAQPSAWKLPPLSLLKRGKAQEIDQAMVEAEGRTLERALAAHGVDTALVGMTVGPTVTRYELALGPGVKVS